jgi:hypothetical protein
MYSLNLVTAVVHAELANWHPSYSDGIWVGGYSKCGFFSQMMNF